MVALMGREVVDSSQYNYYKIKLQQSDFQNVVELAEA